MEAKKSTYTKTKSAIIVQCALCEKTYAATMIYGGMDIDGEFTTTMAEAINSGDTVAIVNTDIFPVTMGQCECKKYKF